MSEVSPARRPEQTVIPTTEEPAVASGESPTTTPPTPAAVVSTTISQKELDARVEAEVRRRLDVEQARLLAERETAAKEAAVKAAAERDEKLNELSSKLDDTMVEKQVAEAIAVGDFKLAGAGALKFLTTEVKAAVKAGKPVSDAVKSALAENSFLLRASTPPETPKTTVLSTDPSETPSPANINPKEVVDVWKMTRQEYEEYRRSLGLM